MTTRRANMSKPLLTILTDPIPYGRYLPYQAIKRVARRAKYIFQERSYSSHPRFRGHFAVTRSLVQGLERMDADFNYGPLVLRQLADTVVVLAGVDTLRQAIQLKRKGHIRRLFAGPNIVIFSSDHSSILAAPEIEAVITPSQYVDELYIEDNPCLRGKVFSWPAGVDTEYWKPEFELERKRILIFEKQNKGPVGPVQPYADYLRGIGWEVEVMRYGSFRHHEYRDSLQRSCLMLGFVTDESQGIAWAEAWSCDVPTLIWRNTSNVYQGRQYKCSTAPYLCEDNGLFFDDLEHFKEQFAYWETHRDVFQPREWTLSNMSDEVCARQLYGRVTAC